MKKFNVEIHGRGSYQREDTLNLGALYIKEYLNDSEYFNSSYISDNQKDSPRQVAEEIMLRNPSAVGFSLYVWNVNFYLEVMKYLKGGSSIIYFAGGPTIQDMLMESPEIALNTFDFLTLGPGEVSVIQALKYFLCNEKNISWKGIVTKENFSDKKIKEISPQPDNFSSFSVYLRNKEDLLRLKNSDNLLFWETARGCLHNCSYCRYSVYSLKEKAIYQKHIDILKQELDLFKECNIKAIAVLTPTFDYNLDIAKDILREIIKRFRYKDCLFTFECKIEHLDEEIIDLFSQINCLIETGPQSLDDEVLKKCHRPLNREKFNKNIQLCWEKKVKVVLDLIYGLPGDTLNKSLRSLDKCSELSTSFVNLSKLSIIEDTELFREKENYHLICNPTGDIKCTPTFSNDEILYFEDLHFIHDLFAIFQGAPWEKGLQIVNFQGRQTSLTPPFRDVLKEYSISHSECLDLILKYFKYIKRDKHKVFEEKNSVLWTEVLIFIKNYSKLNFYIAEKESERRLIHTLNSYEEGESVSVNHNEFIIKKRCLTSLDIDMFLDNHYSSLVKSL